MGLVSTHRLLLVLSSTVPEASSDPNVIVMSKKFINIYFAVIPQKFSSHKYPLLLTLLLLQMLQFTVLINHVYKTNLDTKIG